MQLNCPACNAKFSIEAALNGADIRGCFVVAAHFPAGVKIEDALCYVALFRPVGNRGLSWKRAHRLITELRGLIVADTVQYKTSAPRPNRVGYWQEALDTILYKRVIEPPLKDHNYLRKIVYDLADRADRKVETKRNRAERRGGDRVRTDTDGHGRTQAAGLGEIDYSAGIRRRDDAEQAAYLEGIRRMKETVAAKRGEMKATEAGKKSEMVEARRERVRKLLSEHDLGD